MKLPVCLSSLLMLALCSSCLQKADKETVKDPGSPKALQEEQGSSGSLISGYRSGDLVDAIYNDLLEKRPDLKKLEDDMAAYNELQRDSLGKYQKYQIKSTLYYQSAAANINTITDSVLKKQMQQIIAASHARYNHKITVIDKMTDALGTKDSTLNNYHAVLKLLVTLPVMEKFQDDALPDDKALQILNTAKQKLIDRTKKLTPKAN